MAKFLNALNSDIGQVIENALIAIIPFALSLMSIGKIDYRALVKNSGKWRMLFLMSTEQKLTGYPSIDKPWLKYYSEDAPEYVNEVCEQSAFHYMESMNAERLEYTALQYFGIKISYKELFRQIALIARALKASGISENDFVSLCMPNIPEMVYFVYALNRIGAVACLIDPRTNAEGILQRVNETKSKMLVVVMDIIPQKISVIAGRLNVISIIGVSPADSLTWESIQSATVKIAYLFKKHQILSRYVAYKDFMELADLYTEDINAPFQKDRLAIIVYTSGTTGTAKGVMITNECMIASKKIIEYGSSYINGNAAFLGVIPFFSAYGAMTGMISIQMPVWFRLLS